MRVFPLVANNTFWSGLNTVGGLSLGLITNIVLARFLGPTALGQYNYWLWLMGLLVLVSSPGLPQAMTKFGAEYLGQQERQTAAALFGWLLVAELGLGILVGGAVLLYAWTAQTADSIALTLIAFSIAPIVVEGLFLAAAKGAQDFRMLSQASLIGGLGYAIGAIAAVSFGFGIYTLLLIFLLRRVVTLILIGWKLPTLYTVRGARAFYISPGLRRRLFLYCRDVTLILVTNAVLYEQSEVYFLKRFATDAEIAFYSQSFHIALKAIAFPAIFSGVLLPAFSSLGGQKDQKQFNYLYLSSNRIVALIAMPIGFGGAAMAPAFVSLYGPEFLAMSPILAILFVGNIVGSIASVSSSMLYSVEEQHFIVRLGLCMALLNIALAFLLIPGYGAIGAALANSGSQVISGVVGITYSSRRLQLSFPLGSLGRVALAALFSAAVAWLIHAWLGSLASAVVAAILAYPVLLRLFAALETSDHAILSQLSQYLPKSLMPAYQRLVHFTTGM